MSRVDVDGVLGGLWVWFEGWKCPVMIASKPNMRAAGSFFVLRPGCH